MVEAQGQGRRRPLSKRAAKLAVSAMASYVAAAYLLAPEYWTLRDRHPLGAPPGYVTTTPQGIPGDPINIALVGTKGDLVNGFTRAGWHAADALTWRTAVDIGESVLLDRPDLDAPVSALTYDGRIQDLAFQKPVGTSPEKRHHVRIWLADKAGSDGRPLWLGAASFDRNVGLSHDTGQITHHIAPDIDTERDGILADLQDAAVIISVGSAPGIGLTQNGRNGSGDRYFTDGEIRIGVLVAAPP